jgi:hypothetical protein
MRSLLLLFIPFLSLSQSPAEWSWWINSSSSELNFKVKIQDGWHLYSQHIQSDIGPVPTSFNIEQLSGIRLVDSVFEPNPIKKYDENFEATLDFFEGEVVFTQKYTGEPNGPITGTITYMLCNDKMCLPPTDLPFSITMN